MSFYTAFILLLTITYIIYIAIQLHSDYKKSRPAEEPGEENFRFNSKDAPTINPINVAMDEDGITLAPETQVVKPTISSSPKHQDEIINQPRKSGANSSTPQPKSEISSPSPKTEQPSYQPTTTIAGMPSDQTSSQQPSSKGASNQPIANVLSNPTTSELSSTIGNTALSSDQSNSEFKPTSPNSDIIYDPSIKGIDEMDPETLQETMSSGFVTEDIEEEKADTAEKVIANARKEMIMAHSMAYMSAEFTAEKLMEAIEKGEIIIAEEIDLPKKDTFESNIENVSVSDDITCTDEYDKFKTPTRTRL